MKITRAQYQKAKEALKKLARHQKTVQTWDDALKGYKPSEGHMVVEMHIKDGKTRYVTEEDEEVTRPLMKAKTA